jgi:uncharacterized protein with HEPN domain
MKRPNAPRLIDIIEAADAIDTFLEGPKTFEEFVNSELLHSGVLYKLVIIGEASAHLSDELKQKYQNVDWVRIKDFRNYIVHEYWGTALPRVWDSATVDNPSLRSYCIHIFKSEFPDLMNYLPGANA